MDCGVFHLMGLGRWYFLMEEQPHICCRFEATKLNSSELFVVFVVCFFFLTWSFNLHFLSEAEPVQNNNNFEF